MAATDPVSSQLYKSLQTKQVKWDHTQPHSWHNVWTTKNGIAAEKWRVDTRTCRDRDSLSWLSCDKLPVPIYYKLLVLAFPASVSSKNFCTESKWPKTDWFNSLKKVTVAKSTFWGSPWRGRFVLLLSGQQYKNPHFNLQQSHCSASNWQSTASKSHHRALGETLIFSMSLCWPYTYTHFSAAYFVC